MMLLDSNIIIYSFSVGPAAQVLLDFINLHSPAVSAVSYVEVTGFHAITPRDLQKANEFFGQARVIEVSWDVIAKAAIERRRHRMSLGDSLIAATALVHGLTLVTHNVADFRDLPGLRVLDPIP